MVDEETNFALDQECLDMARSKRITCNPLPTIGENELRLLVSLLSSENLLEGKDVETFESMFCRYLGVKHCVSFGRGRIALYAILKALGVGAGDEVVLPSYTCFVVPNAVHFSGAEPVYVDIDPLTFNMDIQGLRDKITPRTKVVVPHHLFGQPLDLKPVLELAQEANFHVVEDCAQALGATYNGRKVGTFGDAAFFSFDFSKNITTGQGGVAVTNSSTVAQKLREIRDSFPFPSKAYVYSMILALIRGTYLLEPSASLTRALIGELVNKYVTVAQDFRYITREKSLSKGDDSQFFCLPNALAKVGTYQLRKVDDLNQRRKAIAGQYNELLSELRVPRVHVIPNAEHEFLRYSLRSRAGGELKSFLRRYQIVSGNWFDYVIHPNPVQREALGYIPGACPNAEAAAQSVANIPNHPKMSNEDADYVMSVLRLYYSRA